MKSIFKAIFFSLILCTCSVPDTETQTEVTEDLALNIDIPDGFDFRTHQEVKVTINDDSDYVRYDVFAYSDELFFVGNETFEDQSGEIIT